MSKTAVVLGAGPGLGMSVAHRLGREGYTVALVSRTDERHGTYLSSLADQGIEAGAYTADVRDRERLLAVLDEITERHGTIDLLYYGPAPSDPEAWPKPITEADADSVRTAMSWVLPALDAVGKVLPGMVERGTGALLFATGISAVTPLPMLGNLALSSAALHNYAVTLHTALADKGVYAGTLVIGGAVVGGDIHRMFAAQSEHSQAVEAATLDPDEIADEAWRLLTERNRPEALFDALPSWARSAGAAEG
jgi:short-subunit dehydrogenase